MAVRVWADEDYDAPLRKVQVRSDAAIEFLTTVLVEKTGLSTAYASVQFADYRLASATYDVACTNRV